MATEFGKDTSCSSELRTGRYAKGVRLVAESYYRRLTTPRGTLRGGEEEANFGLDLVGKLGSASTKRDAAALPGQIQSELMKDERTLSVDVTVAESVDGPSTSWVVTVEASTTEGPFTLQLSVDDVSVDLLGISES